MIDIKRIIIRLLSLVVIICCLFNSCFGSTEKDDVKEYQYMYHGISREWNKLTTPNSKRDSLLGYGSYLYNSYLILFPRETPTTLKEYYFHWTPLIDVDGYAIYFTCELAENDFALFVEGLKSFGLQNKTTSIKPLFDNSHFSLPTYILQWSKVEAKWEVLEYIMIDEETKTVVFVYTMGELENIEEHSQYTVTPKELHFLEEDFSIYDDFENSVYDISFLEYLK